MLSAATPMPASISTTATGQGILRRKNRPDPTARSQEATKAIKAVQTIFCQVPSSKTDGRNTKKKGRRYFISASRTLSTHTGHQGVRAIAAAVNTAVHTGGVSADRRAE